MAQGLPEIKAFLTCDRVSRQQNKLTCEGIFTTIYGLVFPMVHRGMAIYVSYIGGEGEFLQVISLLDDTGKVLKQPPPEKVRFPEVGEGVINIEGLELPAPGRYWLSLSLNGEEVKRIPVAAVQIPLRERFTEEQMRKLLANPRSIKKVRAQAECNKCGRKYVFQMTLDPNLPLDEGARPFPESKSFVCECGVTHDLRETWARAWQMVGSVQPEEKPEKSQET